MSLKNLKKPSLIKPKKFRDRRGFFQELHLEKKFNLKIKFTASAYSKKNVIRGLHFQFKNMQSKLIYVSSGKILDIAVNLKKKSPNFGKVYKFILNEGDMVYIPEFYAHGYECLSKTCKVIYHLEKYRDSKK
jgi:dTDP-4-dehydrorhamnose 3,5-epimerase and related enzymes